MKYMLKKTACLQWSMVVALGPLCFLWHLKPVACRRQGGFNQVSGENIMLSVRELGHHWTFQQDNDPRHTSKSWKFLELQSQSPDLNSTEHLWWDLKKAVAACKPKNIFKLEAMF